MDVLKVVVEVLLPVFAMALLAVLAPLARKGGQLLAAKADIQTKLAFEDLLEQMVRQSIHFAEERARQALKVGEVMGGPEKLSEALAFVRARLAEAGWLDLGAERLRSAIEAALHYERPVMESEAAPEAEPEAPATDDGNGTGGVPAGA